MTERRSGSPLAVTMGEPAGIGGDISLKAWRRRTELERPFFVIDDPDRLRSLSARMNIDVPVAEIAEPEEAAAAFGEALPVLRQSIDAPVVPGKLDAANAPAVIAAIDRAVALAIDGRVAAIVTNPIHKKCLYQAGFDYPGHTEYLAALAGGGARSVMMLACPGLRVVPVTIHMALGDAIAALDADDIVRCGAVTDHALRRDFAIAAPRIAVAGLNPHAGEDGSIGREEIARTAVDYLALGHWNRAGRVGGRGVPAYYSGSPDLSGSVNVVRLKPGGEVAVRRRRLEHFPAKDRV